jgi:hypothetical protein
MILSWRHALLYLAPLIGHFLRHPLTVAIGIVDFGDHRRDLADFRVVPTVNPKQPSIACESVDNHGDGRSPQVDLVRRGQGCSDLASLANRSSRPRHQLNVLRRRAPKRVAVSNIDRLVFGRLYHLAPEVLDAVKILEPETIIRWQQFPMCKKRGLQAPHV